MVLKSGQRTLSTFIGQHWTNICKRRPEQMVSQWMLAHKCWICQQGMPCDDLRSCKLAIRSSEDRYVQVDRSYSIFCQIAFQAGKHPHLGLIHCFLFSLLSLFPVLLALHHFLVFPFPVTFFLLWSWCSRGPEQFGLIYSWLLPAKVLHAKWFQLKKT